MRKELAIALFLAVAGCYIRRLDRIESKARENTVNISVVYVRYLLYKSRDQQVKKLHCCCWCLTVTQDLKIQINSAGEILI